MHPIPVHLPWNHVGMDFIGPIGPISNNGNRFILTLSDYFSKLVEAVLLPMKEATGVAASFIKVDLYTDIMYTCIAVTTIILQIFVIANNYSI